MTLDMARAEQRPILFSGPMVRAILDGRKTQTRRVVKPQAEQYVPDLLQPTVIYPAISQPLFPKADISSPIRCFYGVPGDLLYVRETWNVHKAYDDLSPRDIRLGADDKIGYEATGSMYFIGRKRPSIHMPKRFARIWLRVTDVRVERVQEITSSDVFAEGLSFKDIGVSSLIWPQFDNAQKTGIARAAFHDIWDSINAKRGYGWDADPWVWAVTFERVEAP